MDRALKSGGFARKVKKTLSLSAKVSKARWDGDFTNTPLP